MVAIPSLPSSYTIDTKQHRLHINADANGIRYHGKITAIIHDIFSAFGICSSTIKCKGKNNAIVYLNKESCMHYLQRNRIQYQPKISNQEIIEKLASKQFSQKQEIPIKEEEKAPSREPTKEPSEEPSEEPIKDEKKEPTKEPIKKEEKKTPLKTKDFFALSDATGWPIWFEEILGNNFLTNLPELKGWNGTAEDPLLTAPVMKILSKDGKIQSIVVSYWYLKEDEKPPKYVRINEMIRIDKGNLGVTSTDGGRRQFYHADASQNVPINSICLLLLADRLRRFAQEESLPLYKNREGIFVSADDQKALSESMDPAKLVIDYREKISSFEQKKRSCSEIAFKKPKKAELWKEFGYPEQLQKYDIQQMIMDIFPEYVFSPPIGYTDDEVISMVESYNKTYEDIAKKISGNEKIYNQEIFQGKLLKYILENWTPISFTLGGIKKQAFDASIVKEIETRFKEEFRNIPSTPNCIKKKWIMIYHCQEKLKNLASDKDEEKTRIYEEAKEELTKNEGLFQATREFEEKFSSVFNQSTSITELQKLRGAIIDLRVATCLQLSKKNKISISTAMQKYEEAIQTGIKEQYKKFAKILKISDFDS